ncbi:MAG: response regulator transcription factor [Opitutaceae bacterium]|jgi:DNA-binding NarL/FixJ family response regulator
MRRVLIVEDIPEARLWLVDIARAAFPECETDQAATLREALELCAGRAYDLALIDLRLPDGSGLGVIRKLRSSNAATLCVVTTVMGDDANIVTALSAGAKGYLLKDQPRELFTRQLAQVAEGVPALSPPVARRIMDHFRLTGPSEEADGTLTPRELEVLGLIARGLRIADAACALGVADGTVASHIKAIYRKLDISSRAEAALHASRLGLLKPESRPPFGQKT